jgi:hypothetical protein
MRGLALASALFGLALLTKFTSVLVVGPCLLALTARIWADGKSAESAKTVGALASRHAAALLAPMLALAGPFYLRNLLRYGELFVGNWSLSEPGRIWWSPPGFHTPQYYLSFGGVFQHPYLSGLTSFWDALYSTFWGDGLLAGQTYLSFRHGVWNYEFMSAGYLLAIPATLVLLAGCVRCCRDAIAADGAMRRLTSGLLVTVAGTLLFAVFFATLGLPFYGQARALYLCAGLPIAAYFFASELGHVDDWLAKRDQTAARTLLVAALGSLFGTFYLAFAG